MVRKLSVSLSTNLNNYVLGSGPPVQHHCPTVPLSHRPTVPQAPSSYPEPPNIPSHVFQITALTYT